MSVTATEAKSGVTITCGDFDRLCDALAKAEASFKELADPLLTGHLSKSGTVPRADTLVLLLQDGRGYDMVRKARRIAPLHRS